MINKVFNTITITLIALIAIGMCGTFLSDYLISINWFGDYEVKHLNYWDSGKDVVIKHWGARHYWYNWGCFSLFITALVRGIVKVDNIASLKGGK